MSKIKNGPGRSRKLWSNVRYADTLGKPDQVVVLKGARKSRRDLTRASCLAVSYVCVNKISVSENIIMMHNGRNRKVYLLYH